jgi:glycosyltransferase involved in cell wall biosynthesis
MTRPLVSVNICTWRPQSDYFIAAVQSILDQTFTDYELIIVEDPSEVDGKAILGHLLNDQRIRYIQNPHRTGLLAQKNQALELSRGEFVAILDHDDIAARDRLEKQVVFLNEQPTISVVGAWIRAIDERGNPIGIRKYPTHPETVRKALRRFSPIAHPACMFRREDILQLGGYTWKHRVDPLGLVSDYDLWCRLAIAGRRMANLPEVLLDYRLHTRGQKHLTTRSFILATLIIKLRYFKRDLTAGDWARYLGELCLLGLPSKLVYRMFLLLSYR